MMTVTASDKRRQQGSRDASLLSLEKITIPVLVDVLTDAEDNTGYCANGEEYSARRGQRAIHVTHSD